MHTCGRARPGAGQGGAGLRALGTAGPARAAGGPEPAGHGAGLATLPPPGPLLFPPDCAHPAIAPPGSPPGLWLTPPAVRKAGHGDRWAPGRLSQLLCQPHGVSFGTRWGPSTEVGWRLHPKCTSLQKRVPTQRWTRALPGSKRGRGGAWTTLQAGAGTSRPGPGRQVSLPAGDWPWCRSVWHGGPRAHGGGGPARCRAKGTTGTGASHEPWCSQSSARSLTASGTCWGSARKRLLAPPSPRAPPSETAVHSLPVLLPAWPQLPYPSPFTGRGQCPPCASHGRSRAGRGDRIGRSPVPHRALSPFPWPRLCPRSAEGVG